jgi:outer membrane protein
MRTSTTARRVLVGMLGWLAWAMVAPLEAQTVALSPQETPGGAAKPFYAIVVDIQSVLQRAKASASVQRQIDEQRESYQVEIAKQENELRQAERTLQEQRNLIEQDEFDRRRRAFEKRLAEVQTLVQSRRQVLEKAYGAANTRIRTTMLKIIADVAEREHVALVLSKQQVVMMDRSLERTDAILEALDAQLPEITVDLQ